MPKKTRKYKCTNGRCDGGYEAIKASCVRCEGRGWVNNGDDVCPECDGEKYLWKQTSHTCETCEGRGFIVEIVEVPDPPTQEEIEEQKQRDEREAEARREMESKNEHGFRTTMDQHCPGWDNPEDYKDRSWDLFSG